MLLCLKNSSCYWKSSLIQHNVHIYFLIWDLLPTSLSRTMCYLAVCSRGPNWTELHENLKSGMGFGGARMSIHILYSFSPTRLTDIVMSRKQSAYSQWFIWRTQSSHRWNPPTVANNNHFWFQSSFLIRKHCLNHQVT